MKINKFNGLFAKIRTVLTRNKFYSLGKKSVIFFPLSIDNPSTISIGSNCFVGEGTWLMGNNKNKSNATLVIKDGTIIGHNAHIVALKKVIIEEKVLMADRVFITDSEHNFEDVSRPIMDQGVKIGDSVTIGSGSWIGENVSIISSNVGKNCVIGANAVVTKDIPDYCVAVGSPARVIRKYNMNEKKWIKC